MNKMLKLLAVLVFAGSISNLVIADNCDFCSEEAEETKTTLVVEEEEDCTKVVEVVIEDIKE